MGIASHKIGLTIVILVVAGYVGVSAWRMGSLSAFVRSVFERPNRVVLLPGRTVGASVLPSASVPAATPVVSKVSSPLPASPAPVTTADAVFRAVNAQRTAAGVAAVMKHATLQYLAQAHADDMAKRGYFSHTDPEGTTFQDRMSVGGYAGSAQAENLGLSSESAVAVVDGWMDSQPHRINLLNESYVAAGIGVAIGTYQGMQVSLVVAIFGNSKE